jgi:hypothetical protein
MIMKWATTDAMRRGLQVYGDRKMDFGKSADFSKHPKVYLAGLCEKQPSSPSSARNCALRNELTTGRPGRAKQSTKGLANS